MTIQLIHADCLEVDWPQVDAIIFDPPYNISKAKWDKWKKQEDYINWMGKLFIKAQSALKDNGSMYFFHNDMEQIAMLMEWIRKNTKFVFKQFIVWNKRFQGYHNQIHAIVHSEENRNYPKIAEYILFYTFQDETGLSTVMLDTNNFSTLRKYFKEYQQALGMSLKRINSTLGHRKAEHCFYWKTTQWDMPTPETYAQLASLPIHNEFVRREYEDLRREYEDLRREYEDLRYTFNNQKSHHSVWNYEIAKANGHITPKPVDLMENIIRHSTNEGDTVLDFCAGSGTTLQACINTGRNGIGIEKDEKYYNIAKERLGL